MRAPTDQKTRRGAAHLLSASGRTGRRRILVWHRGNLVSRLSRVNPVRQGRVAARVSSLSLSYLCLYRVFTVERNSFVSFIQICSMFRSSLTITARRERGIASRDDYFENSRYHPCADLIVVAIGNRA